MGDGNVVEPFPEEKEGKLIREEEDEDLKGLWKATGLVGNMGMWLWRDAQGKTTHLPRLH